MTLPEIVTVNVAALNVEHLIVVDGQVREIARLAPDRTVLTYRADDSTGALQLDPGGLIPCVRRADWQVPS